MTFLVTVWLCVLAVAIWFYLGIIRRLVKKIENIVARTIVAAAYGAISAAGVGGVGGDFALPLPALLVLIEGSGLGPQANRANAVSLVVSIALLVAIELVVSLRAKRIQ